MIDPAAFYEALLARKMDRFFGVPDSLLKNLCACITEKSAKDNVICANEGNAVGMACGYHVSSGRYGVVYMQNSGLGNTVNPLLSIADEAIYAIPMLLVFLIAFKPVDPYGGIGDGWTMKTWFDLRNPSYPSIIWRTLSCRSSALSPSPVKMWSEMLSMLSARFFDAMASQ